MPTGVRTSVTESWGALEFSLTNATDADRQARVLALYGGQTDVQYGRDVWVPAGSTLSSWMLVGPAAVQQHAAGREIQVLLYDRSEGKERLILPPGEERVRSRAVPFRKREPFTAILIDQAVSEEPLFGRLPRLESRVDEALRFARTFRHAYHLPEFLQVVPSRSLPPAAEAFDGVDHFVLASDHFAHDPAGVQGLRRWLQRGGRLWVMLDLVEPETLAPLLGEALDFQVVDRVSLTTFKLEAQPAGQSVTQAPVQQHERPVDLIRVLLPPHERARYTVNGWPVWFSRQVGRGEVLFTTLGARGWFRPRTDSDPLSPYQNYPSLPVPRIPLEVMAAEFFTSPESPFRVEAFRPALAEEVGYSVVGRGTVALVFGTFLLATLALGVVLRRSRRPELLGWLAPAAALGTAGVFLALGAASRRAVPPTVAVAQVVEAIPGTEEAAARGLLAMYRPHSGPAEVSVRQGGLLELDMAGLEDQNRRLVMTDMDSWHWENLSLPAGLRFAPFRYTARTGEPITAVARLGPEGLEGRLTTGPFQGLSDAILRTPDGRNLSVQLKPDGTFSAGTQDALPPGQFLVGAVLSDRQQRRQELYREFLKRPKVEHQKRRTALLAWAEPIDMHFRLVPEARTVGDALLVIPLQLERAAPGTRLTVPGPLVSCRQIVRGAQARLTRESRQGTNLHLRFQLPAEVLPLEVERARLVARINAPSRRVSIAGQGDGRTVEVHSVESPLDPIRIDITDKRLLRPDAEGGLHLHLTISEPFEDGGTARDTSRLEAHWVLEYIELEVTGRVSE